MKITGLITEYNPFHNGHLYHMVKSKEITGADYCIVLMSGSFVQRGEPAVYDKYLRTSMALQSGADLVLEMPAAFSTASAREFASYAAALFTSLGAVDSICFGSECGSMEPLLKNAAFLLKEPEEYSTHLKEYLKSGMTFPQAREKALLPYSGLVDTDVLSSPNNILGTEYCKAVLERHSPLSLYTIKREGNSYHDCSTDGKYGSATAIRQVLSKKGDITSVRHLIPPNLWEAMMQESPLFLNDFSSALNYQIWTEQTAKILGSAPATLEGIADMTTELASRIQNSLPGDTTGNTFEERIQSLKSRDITYTRVSRALLHLLLHMQTSETEEYKQAGYALYARVLGFKKESAPLLSILKESSTLPLITKLADAPKLLSPLGLKMLNQEIAASHLYQSVKREKGCAFKNEYTQPLTII